MGEKENGIEGMLITSLTDEDLFAAGRRPSALDSKQSRTTDSEISGEVIHQVDTSCQLSLLYYSYGVLLRAVDRSLQ